MLLYCIVYSHLEEEKKKESKRIASLPKVTQWNYECNRGGGSFIRCNYK